MASIFREILGLIIDMHASLKKGEFAIVISCANLLAAFFMFYAFSILILTSKQEHSGMCLAVLGEVQLFFKFDSYLSS